MIKLRDLLEDRAAWFGAGAEGYWIHMDGEVIDLGSAEHDTYVKSNPDKFGITQDDIDNMMPGGWMNKAYENGWIRLTVSPNEAALTGDPRAMRKVKRKILLRANIGENKSIRVQKYNMKTGESEGTEHFRNFEMREFRRFLS